MFRDTRLPPGGEFPLLPFQNPDFASMLRSLGVEFEGTDDPTHQLAWHALHNWVEGTSGFRALAEMPLADSLEQKTLAAAGFIEAIKPPVVAPDHILIDGGVRSVVDYRLDHFEELRQQGQLQPRDVVVFGGQCLQKYSPEERLRNEKDAIAFLDRATPWQTAWLSKELAKDNLASNPWHRQFAAEHETTILSLIGRYGRDLEHIQTVQSKEPIQSIDTSIPDLTVQAEIFAVGDVKITVLNAPAVLRKYGNRILPTSQARATGVSCFEHWLTLAEPAQQASVLLLTHNPYIYRSWLDLQLVARHRRPDLEISAAGARAEEDCRLADVLRSLGKIAFTTSKHIDPGRQQVIAYMPDLRYDS